MANNVDPDEIFCSTSSGSTLFAEAVCCPNTEENYCIMIEIMIMFLYEKEKEKNKSELIGPLLAQLSETVIACSYIFSYYFNGNQSK